MATPTELFIADELPRRPYTLEFPFAAGKTLITTGVGLEVIAGDAPGEYLDNTFRIKDNDDTTKKIAFQASGIATGQERTITMPNADVDLGAVTTSVLATGGAWTYTTGMGSVVITATIGSNSFNVVDLGSNLMHSVTIRHGDFTSQYNDDPITFILTTETTSCTFYDETGTIILGTAISGTPLSVTIRPGESWEIRALASTDTFSVVRSFYPLLPIPNLKLRNSTTSALGYTLAGTVITTDKVITLPNADVNLGDLPFVATTNSNALGRTTARILNGSSNTANGTLGVILTGIGITTNLGGAVVQGAYQTVYANQAAVKQSVMIVGQTTANVLTELTNCGTGGVITAAGDTIYILATKPNGMSNTNGVGIHRITLTGSNQTTGATYFGFSGEYIVTCSYNGTTTVIDAITTVHTSLRAGVAETFTPSFTLDVTTANAALLIGVTTTLGNVRCAGHVESVYS